MVIVNAYGQHMCQINLRNDKKCSVIDASAAVGVPDLARCVGNSFAFNALKETHKFCLSEHLCNRIKVCKNINTIIPYFYSKSKLSKSECN